MKQMNFFFSSFQLREYVCLHCLSLAVGQKEVVEEGKQSLECIEIPKQSVPCASAATWIVSQYSLEGIRPADNSQDKVLRQPGLHTLPKAKNDRVVCAFTLSLSLVLYVY